MNNANKAFVQFWLLFFLILLLSVHIFPSLLRSRRCIRCRSRPILQTASQGHSQSKCMLMLRLEELPACLPGCPPSRLSAPKPDVALGSPREGAADAKAKVVRQQEAAKPSRVSFDQSSGHSHDGGCLMVLYWQELWTIVIGWSLSGQVLCRQDVYLFIQGQS